MHPTLIKYARRVTLNANQYLNQCSQVPCEKLMKAINYVLSTPGKCLRPALAYATNQALGGDLSDLDHDAAAIELVHTYSLVHDDLPAMDNDDLRRGKATCHKQFDDAIAILVGDGLQSLAFEIMALNPKSLAQRVTTLAQAIGISGMVAGQSMDMSFENKKVQLKMLEQMHLCKTGCLIHASIRLGAMSALPSEQQSTATLELLDQFAFHLGLAFQIKDDILDVEGTTDELGKLQGQDIAQNKSTYVSLMGLDSAKQSLQQHVTSATNCLDQGVAEGMIKEPDELNLLLNLIVQRRH